MSTFKYLVEGSRSDRIRKVEVVKETEKTVTIMERGWGKPSERKLVRPDVFDTFDQAKSFMIEKAEEEVQSIRRMLEQQNGRLGNLRGLKESGIKS